MGEGDKFNGLEELTQSAQDNPTNLEPKDSIDSILGKLSNWLYEKRWNIAKIVFCSYLSYGAYKDIGYIPQMLDFLAEHSEDKNERLYEMIFRPLWESSLDNIRISLILSFLSYYTANRVGGRRYSEQEIFDRIEEWKRIIGEKKKGVLHEIGIYIKSLAAAGLMISPPLIARGLTTGFKDVPTNKYLVMGGATAFLFVLFQHVFKYADYIRKPILNNLYEIASNGPDQLYYQYIKKNYQLSLEKFAMFSDCFDKSMRWIRPGIANMLIKLGEYESALDLFRSEIENSSMLEKGSLVDSLISEPLALYVSNKMGSREEISKPFEHLPKRPSKFLKSFGKIAAERDSIDLKALYAIAHSQFYKGKDREQKSKELWGQVLENILKMPKSKFRPLAGSSNEVLVYSPEEGSIISKLLVFKRGEKLILKDYFVNLFSDRITVEEIDSGNLDNRIVPEPIDYYPSNGYFLDVTRREDSSDLNSIPKEELAMCLPRVVMNLAALQGIATRNLKGSSRFKISDGVRDQEIDLGCFNYELELNNRVFNRFGLNEHSRKIIELLVDYLQENITPYKFFIHGDFYKTNALYSGLILDFERSSIGDPFADLALILLSTGFSDDENLVHSYIENLRKYSRHDINPDAARCSFDAHLIFYSLCLSGSRIYHKDPRGGEFYIAKTTEMAKERKLNMLKEHFMHYTEKCLEPHLS